MEQNGKLIVSALSGDEICRHDVCKLKGKKIIQRSHGRDMEPKIEQLIDAVCHMFEDQIKAREWIMMIKVHKKRYIRDQLQMLGQIIGENLGMDISKALDYVHANNILSATDFRAYLVYLKSERSEETRSEAKIIKLNPLSGNRNTQLEIEPQKSDLGNYEALFSQQ
jgi:hypothetical protein